MSVDLGRFTAQNATAALSKAKNGIIEQRVEAAALF
jgi:hypothetical protein